jgi:hypothetical protein
VSRVLGSSSYQDCSTRCTVPGGCQPLAVVASTAPKTVAELDAGIGIQGEETLEVYLTGWLRGCLDRVRLGDMEENTLETYRVHIETMIAPTAQVAARYRTAVVRRSAAALLDDPDAEPKARSR